MSTYLYLRCESHDPPIESWSESGQHLSDLEHIREDLANRDLIAKAVDLGFTPTDMWQHYRSTTARFISQHRNCEISIWDEYGREHSLTEDDEE